MIQNETSPDPSSSLVGGNGSEFRETEFPGMELELLNNQQMALLLPAIIYTAILMVVGAPGNIIVLYVYFFKWRRSASRMFILFLAALDLVNCVSTLPMEIYVMRYSLMMDLPLVCKFSRCSTYLMNSSSAAILVAIAVDRFKRICRPYEANMTDKTCKYICIGCILFSVCITWPPCILYGTREIVLKNGVVAKACLLENKFDKTPYPLIYFIFMGGSTVVIFTTLSVLYYFVALQIYKRRVFKMSRCSRVQVVAEETTGPTNCIVGHNDEAHCNGVETADKALLNEEDVPSASTRDSKSKESCNANTKAGSSSAKTSNGNKVSDTSSSSKKSEEVSYTCFSTDTSCLAKTGSGVSSQTEGQSGHRTRLRHLLLRGDSNMNSSTTHCVYVRIGKSTLMLFLITLAYIISFLPFYIIAILRQSDKHFVQTLSKGGYMTYQLFLRSYLLSSAINPIIYSFCNERFRKFCRDIFRRRRRQSA